ncbi:MAG: OmpA family protein, partial [Bacteroidota bacterium]
GKYLVSLPSGKNYGIAVKAETYLFHSENFNIPEATNYQEITKDILLNKMDIGSKIILKNIFFDYAKATLRSESFPELDRLVKLLTDFPTSRIEISGHTDNQGSLKTNQTLSESRAKSVVDYLIGKGISQSRLEFKGYAYFQPIATNDNDEGRQQNRRVEFKVLSK